MPETWALLSDIHGNLPALRRALDYARAEGASRIAFLGDVLGGPEEEACCRLLMAEADIALFGNREVRAKLDFPPDVTDWLRELRATYTLGQALLCHSSPASALPPDISARDALVLKRKQGFHSLFPFIQGAPSALAAGHALAAAADSLRTAFFGHTHRQAVWLIRGDAAERSRETDIRLGEEAPAVIGLGAVGQGPQNRVEFGLYHPVEARVRLVSLP